MVSIIVSSSTTTCARNVAGYSGEIGGYLTTADWLILRSMMIDALNISKRLIIHSLCLY